MNLFFLADIISLALLLLIVILFIRFKSFEEPKYHSQVNALLFGMFFVMVYFILNIVAFLLASYNYSTTMLVYSSEIIVIPLASIFFFVSVLLRD